MSRSRRSQERKSDEKPDGGVKSAPAAATGRVRGRVFSGILLLIPLGFFVVLECALRLGGYGSEYRQWVKSSTGQWVDGKEPYYILNPDIALKYFHVNRGIPAPTQDPFATVKSPSAFRIFVLGESSGAGYPYEPNGSFPRFLRERLIAELPGRTVEVVNCSMSAISTYTLRDLTPGIIEQHPDLVLIYAGHNEYYGALGVGSVESFGGSRFLVNLSLALEPLRTIQLLRQAIAGIAGVFTPRHEGTEGTLMERMAADRLIPYGSTDFRRGVSQFAGNMSDILTMLAEAHVPVIIATVASNLKDQPPFVTDSSGTFPRADTVFGSAERAWHEGRLERADSLFRAAKDLDALRFRAPDTINAIIRGFGRSYPVHVLDVDSAFRAVSPDHLVGANLMVDHLHPTFEGYRYMGELFLGEMRSSHLLPSPAATSMQPAGMEDTVQAGPRLSRLDSVMVEYKMKVLKSGWPFHQGPGRLQGAEGLSGLGTLLQPHDHVDSLALGWMQHRIHWKNAHLAAAEWFLDHSDLPRFLREMDALILQYPHMPDYVTIVCTTLLQQGENALAQHYLQRSYHLQPGAFNCKWLGMLRLADHDNEGARRLLQESLGYDDRDSEVWVNLAAAFLPGDRAKARLLVDKALAIDPGSKQALAMRTLIMSTTH